MEIRPYKPADDPALIQLERLSSRGFPPFIHFRRRFIDRAELYPSQFTLVAEENQQIIGVSSIIVKDALISGQPAKVAYSFDTRVHPAHRRHGVGHAMVEEKLKWAQAQGAVGVYSLIVATNNASLGMVEKSGYQKKHMILYLQFQPYPLISPLTQEPQCSPVPIDQDLIHSTYQKRDLYVTNLADRLQHLDYQRWFVRDSDNHYAALSVYDQSKVYVHMPAEDPYPTTEQEIERLGRALQIFDAVGMDDHPELIFTLLQRLRDEAVSTNVNKLTWLLDRSDHLPAHIFDETVSQLDYWLMYRSFNSDAPLDWTESVYLDPRDI